MKGLSIKEKAKRYDEAIEAAVVVHKDEDKHLKATLERIFPELKEESEDEKIRKALIKGISKTRPNTPFLDTNITREDAIVWLEKQGEPQGKSALESAKEEKVDNQNCVNPADKVEPKFKVGDLVTDDGESVFHITVDNNMYQLETSEGTSCHFSYELIERKFHLWTIEDAKEGDMLINWNNTIFIFKAIEDETVKFHIAYNEKWDAVKTQSTKLSHLGLPEPQFEFRPATKEQRDLLFSKMKESGYVWDAAKKKLEKIEQKPAEWNEEDEGMVTRIVKSLSAYADKLQHEGFCHNSEVLYEQINWLKSLRPQNKYTYNPYKAVVESIAAMVEKYAPFDSNLQDFYDNVKVKCKDAKEYDSLYPQNTWKPSDKQMVTLEYYMHTLVCNNYKETLFSLYEDLKKLMKE